MTGSISLGRLPSGRVPAVVLGDLTLVRPHGMADIPVVVVTADPRDVALRSRFVHGSCVVPGFDEGSLEESAKILLDLGARIQAVCGSKVPLVYGSDNHVELLLRHRQALSEHYAFTMCPNDMARALHDKERFYEVAEAAGIRVPKTRRPGAGPERGLSDLRGPVLIKPRRKTDWAEIRKSLFEGSAKARVFATRKELLGHPAFERFASDLIVQEHIAGDVGALVSFHGFADREGRILASFCGRKVRTWPRFAGESSFIELTVDPPAGEVGRDVAARLGLRGPFKIDLIRDARSGDLYVLEINARFNLWHYLGAVHGVNLPAVAYEYHLYGRSESPGEYQPRYRWVDLYRDFKAFQEQHRAGAMTLEGWLSSLAGKPRVYDTFAWGDPAPLFQWAKDFIARRYSGGTVRNPGRHSR